MAPRFIARQLARPQGFPGRLIGRLMQETERWAEGCMADRSLDVT